MLAAQGRLDDVDVVVDVMGILDVSGIPSQHAARRRGRRDDLIGLPTTWVLPASPRGPHEVRHARRPHTLQEETPRPAPRRRPQQARHDRTMGCPQWGESGAWRPAFRALGDFHRRPADARRVVKARATAFVGRRWVLLETISAAGEPW
jgi:hypothetical protein